MDAELQETVEQLVGAGAQVLDCEKRSVVREEEVLLVNGQPLQLQGHDGAAIRKALLAGHVPPHDLLNTVLVRAGILRSPVRLETSLQVKSSVVTREEVTVARGGRVVDERSRQTQEDNVYNSSTSETWEPVAGSAAPAALAAAPATVRPQLSRHGKAQAPQPPPLAAAAAAAAAAERAKCCSPPLSSSSSSGFWSPGPGGPGGAPSRSVSGSSCGSGPAGPAPGQPSHAAPPPAAPPPGAAMDEVDAALSRDLDAVHLQATGASAVGGVLRDNPASPPHHSSHHYSSGCDAGPSSSGCQSQIKRSSSRPCNVPGCNQPGCGRAAGSMAGPPQHAQRPQEHTMVYREDTLVSGALEALLRHAIPTAEYFPEDAYLFAFILCARIFVPLNEVLLRVIRSMDRCKDERRAMALARNVLRFLREWTDSFPHDFREDKMMALCIEVTQRLVELLPAVRREVSELQTDLLAKLTAVETYEEFLNRCGDARYVDSVEELTAAQQADKEPVATPCYLLQGSRTDVMDMVRTPTKLAHQLTHVELERLSHIGPEEFVLAFMKERGLNGDAGDAPPIKKTRSKEAYEDWFSRLSYLVATEICKHPKKKQRLRVLDFWVQTARECYNIGNFNSLMAINAGLSLAPVARLKKTWSKVHCVKCFTVLQNLMSMSDNYKSYRSTLAAAVKRSKQQNVAAQVPGAQQPPEASNDYIVVPFFYLLVKDLHFLNVGCADRLPNGHINFEKFWQLAKQVTEFIAWKQAVCPFPKNTDVIMYLQTSPLLSDDALALASFECEAPDNGPEKEHLKSLKKNS